MAIADLEEGHGRGLRGCFPHDAERGGHATRNGREDAGAGPGHAFEDFAPADAVPVFVMLAHGRSPGSTSASNAMTRRPSGLFPMFRNIRRPPRSCGVT